MFWPNWEMALTLILKGHWKWQMPSNSDLYRTTEIGGKDLFSPAVPSPTAGQHCIVYQWLCNFLKPQNLSCHFCCCRTPARGAVGPVSWHGARRSGLVVVGHCILASCSAITPSLFAEPLMTCCGTSGCCAMQIENRWRMLSNVLPSSALTIGFL